MNRLWYKKPAENWNEALPLGNGRLGAMVYGGIDSEVIQLNEESVWSGTFRDRNNRSCKSSLRTIRSMLAASQIQEAQDLAFRTMTGCPSQQTVYQTAGEFHIDFFTPENKRVKGPLPCDRKVFKNVSVYKRELDLENAIFQTSFCTDSETPSTAYLSKNTRGSSITYTREVFVSALLDVIVIHLSASTPKSINFRAYFDRGNFAGKVVNFEDDTIAMQSTTGIPFCAMANANISGGSISVQGNCLVAENCDDVTIYIDIQTAYRKASYRKRGGNIHRSQQGLATWCTDEALKKICFASSGTYDDTRKLHVYEYSQLYRRISLELEKEHHEDAEKFYAELPTDELLSRHTKDPALAELYWNYGRYLLLSSSRKPGTLPANLQGLWNCHMDPPWGSKYTININTEMNYWPAQMCCMEETSEALFNLIRRAYKNGKRTAISMYGCGGYLFHHNLDIWGDSAPQDQWIPGTYWVTGAAWLATHIREQFEYTQDMKFLKKNFYLLKEACDFFSEYMVTSISNPKYSVVAPSVSPENTYRLPNGEEGSFSYGTDMDNRIIEHLLKATIESAKDLGISDTDSDVLKYRNLLSKIEGVAVTKEGTIREWPFEYEETEPGHRHISQLYGLFPGCSINYERNRELAEACRRTIEKRLKNGGGHTGWSQAWIMNFWASLHDGEKCYESLNSLLKNSTLPNLFDNHPPFQIDGNFGALTAITRMIVQSEYYCGYVYINLLPSVPPEWKNGKLNGVNIKGNLKMNIEWQDGKLKSANIYVVQGTRYLKKIKVVFEGKEYDAPLTDGCLDILNILPATIQ